MYHVSLPNSLDIGRKKVVDSPLHCVPNSDTIDQSTICVCFFAVPKVNALVR